MVFLGLQSVSCLFPSFSSLGFVLYADVLRVPVLWIPRLQTLLFYLA